MKEKTFEDFLQDKHAETYMGTDDNMSDAFDDWLTVLQADDFIKYGNEYADWKIKECLPDQENYKSGSDNETLAYNSGFEDCRQLILSNKDKIK